MFREGSKMFEYGEQMIANPCLRPKYASCQVTTKIVKHLFITVEIKNTFNLDS